MSSQTQFAKWLRPAALLGLLLPLVAAAPFMVLQSRHAGTEVDIAYPHTGTTWFVGEWHNITWDPCSFPQDFDDTKPGTFVLLNNDTLKEPIPLVTDVDLSLDRVAMINPLPQVANSASYRVGLVVGETNTTTPVCGEDISCSAEFTIGVIAGQ